MLKSLRRKILGDFRANRGQFSAVWLVVGLGTTFYGAMYPAGVNLVDSMYRTYDQLHYMDFQILVGSTSPEVVEPVRTIPGVTGVEGRLVVEGGLQVDPTQKHLINLRLISVPDDRDPQVNQSEITDGETISQAGDILLLKSFADYHGFEPGETLTVMVGGNKHSLRIAGLVFNPEYMVAGRGATSPFPTPSSFGVAWLRYSDLAPMIGSTNEINEIVVRLAGKSDQDRSKLEESVRRALGDLFDENEGVAIYSRTQTVSGGVIDANINGNFPIMIFFSSLFLAGATVITGILLARHVESERQRIGTMRAMGITRQELVIHYISYGFLIGLSGGLVGSVLGYISSFLFMYTFLDYVAGGVLPGFVNTPQIPFILLGLAVVVGCSTIAGAYPAWVQSATPPGIALRPATPKPPNALSRRGLGFLPRIVRQIIRNLLRTPGRSLGTALGVMAGSMMVFSALVLWDTMNSTFDDYFQSTAFDLRVDVNNFQPAQVLEATVQQIDGVQAAQATLIGPVDILLPGGDPFKTVAVAVDEGDPFFELTALEGSAAFAAGDGIWIGHNAQRVLGVGTGDILTIRAFDQEHEVTVYGVVSQVLGSPVFVPRSLLIQWTPGNIFPSNTVLVRTEPGQTASVRDALTDLPEVVAVTVVADFDKDLNHYLEYYRVNTVMFGTFGLILTLALLFNTVNASLRERREELSVLRALGTTAREITFMVTAELLIMVAVGILVGLPLGREAGFYLNHTYDTDFFGQVDSLRQISYLVGALSLLITVMLAEIPGLRAVQRADLGQISKSQSF